MILELLALPQIQMKLSKASSYEEVNGKRKTESDWHQTSHLQL